jgi:hypothetical protein
MHSGLARTVQRSIHPCPLFGGAADSVFGTDVPAQISVSTFLTVADVDMRCLMIGYLLSSTIRTNLVSALSIKYILLGQVV